MPRVSAPLYSLNGGEVGEEALGRLDLERMQFAGSLYSNILPRVVGSMTLRPGLEHIANINYGTVELLEFNYAGASTLTPLLSNNAMRIVRDDALVSRASVSTTVTNGAFSLFTGWTDISTGSATASVTGGNLLLNGARFAKSAARQQVSVAVGDRNVEHGLRVKVTRGPVMVRVGSTSGGDELIKTLTLDDGDHSIAFTPTTASIWIELSQNTERDVLVDSCQIDAAGTLVLETPWTSADLTAKIIRYKQSVDVLFVASNGYQQREIRRYSDTGWGIQRYKIDDGPFVISDGDVSLTPNSYSGNGTLTASQDYFTSGMVGRLFRLLQTGQTVQEQFSVAPAEGASVRVSGVGADRQIRYQTGGTFSGTVTLQVALDDGAGNPTSWVDVLTRTTAVSETYTDPDDNVIKYFRFVVKTGDLASGTIGTIIEYAGGSQTGVCRVTGYTSRTQVSIEILRRFYSLNATTEWDFSTWSDEDGWPSSVELFGGRLYWFKLDLAHGSIPDAFKSFDDEVEGDSAPIARSVGASSGRGVLWSLGLQRLLVGTDASEISIKASSFDDPLTASSWFPVDASTRGCYSIRAVKTDTDGIFIQSSGTAIFRLRRNETGVDYVSDDLTALHEEICGGSPVVDMFIQRRPDTVVWFILANGEARALTYEPAENVIAWSRIATDGLFKRGAASRAQAQDSVVFAIERGGVLRLEKMARYQDCKGGSLNCLADAFSRFTVVSPTTTFSVPHLNGKQVTVWVNGVAVHDQSNLYTVTSSQVVIPSVSSGNVVIGLPYAGRWQSTKLAYGAAGGTALFKRKRVSQIGLYLLNTMLDGLRAGYDFATLRRITTTKGDKPIPAGQLQEAFDMDLFAVSSEWSTDSRVCLEMKTPYPFTASGMVLDVTTNG